VKIIFSGTIGRSGLGGQAWAVLQYLIGLRALGHEVCYLEDCGDCSYVYDWGKQEWTYELDYPAAYVHACLAPFSLGDAWIYRTNAGSRGLPLDAFLDFCTSADLLVMRAVPLWVWRPEYDRPSRRAFIDVDPGFTQISIASGDQGIAEGVARAERRFTIGQHIGDAGCPIPTAGGPWLKTLPPVALCEWPFAEHEAAHFTSVMRWQGFREARFQGAVYGQRDQQFSKYLDLPQRINQGFRLAMMGTRPEDLNRHGWEVAPGEIISATPTSYRDFIRQSRGEFSVPKHGYVESGSGWFSDRSVCYLACGRPVLMEDTSVNDWLPVGEGLVTFKDVDGALSGVNRINANYDQHRRAARRVAENFFAAEKVLPSLLDTAMS
jgi:hypothetical protein